jgi:hypothetical protein
MRKFFTFLFFAAIASPALGQTCKDFAIELTATTQVSPPKITLHWKRLADTTIYKVYKKNKNSVAWSGALATLTTNDSVYTDASVIADSAYEYKVLGSHHAGATRWDAMGYIYAGVKAPAIHSRGGIILMVDSTFSDSCSFEIARLMKELSGDGWQVVRHDVPRTMADTGVKSIITNYYNNIPNIKAVYLLGHVAVPYSGDLNPDGHTEHKGAWPADVYYAHLTATWSDASVNNATSSYTANQNIPGDGKWDLTNISGSSQLQVCRVDFWNMPAFSATEVQLMKRYLNKAHSYKMDSLNVVHRGIISDNFGVFTVVSSGTTYYEAFASSAWRCFAPLVGPDSVRTTNTLINKLDSNSYQWAYGCGGGTFTSAGGIGNTADFATHNVQAIFTMMFGSYFGDWNVQNNFLRAPLCSNIPALTSCWSGRPYWFFHHMALGEHIGYSTWWSQINDGNTYGPANIYGMQQWVHMAMMGDPSLRTDYIQPARNLVVTTAVKQGATLNWTASADALVTGYYVYRATSEFGSYQRISAMIAGTTFRDTVGTDGLKFYMVRPVKLQATPSGSYYNLGLGIGDSATVSFDHTDVPMAAETFSFAVYPNPASSTVHIDLQVSAAEIATINILNMAGATISTAVRELKAGQNILGTDINHLPAGVYFISVTANGYTATKKWVKQ